MKRHVSLLALAIAAAPTLAQAQVYDLGDIIVAANLEPVAADRTGATVTVVTEDELQATAETRLSDYLARLPGVSVNARGPIGTQTGFAIRGASQNYVTVLVDGIDVTDPSGTQVAFDLGNLTTAGISRIEVLKGSQSALYGSRAVGGVISITTRQATENGQRHDIAMEVGSYDTAALSYGFSSKSDTHDLAVTLSHVETAGFSAADENDGNTEADGFRSNRLAFTGSRLLDNGVRIGASGFAETSHGDYDEGFPLGDGTPDETVDRRAQGLRGFTEFQTGGIDNTVSLSVFRAERRYRDDGAFGASDNTYTGTRTKLSYEGATDLGAGARLVFGADLAREEFKARGTYGSEDADTRTAGIFAEVTYAPSDLIDLSATLRHDDHSDFGGHTTGRLAMAWRLQDDLILRAQAGTGFRAPSNYELYSGFGHTGLEPEKSRSADIGIEKRYGDRGMARLTAFWLEVDNLIDYDYTAVGCAFGPGCYNQVSGASRRSGVELEGEVALGQTFTLGANYTYTDSSTSATSAWGAVPRHAVGLTLAAAITPELSGTLTVNHAADRAGLPDYTVANAALTYDFGEGAQAYLRVENLFDKEYQLVNGYGTSDRAVYVGLRKSF